MTYYELTKICGWITEDKGRGFGLKHPLVQEHPLDNTIIKIPFYSIRSALHILEKVKSHFFKRGNRPFLY